MKALSGLAQTFEEAIDHSGLPHLTKLATMVHSRRQLISNMLGEETHNNFWEGLNYV